VSLRRVQWLILAVAVAFVALTDAVSFLPQVLGVGGQTQQHLLLAVLLLAGVLPFTLLAFRFGIAPVYRTIQAQNLELRRMDEAARRHSAQLQAIHEACSALAAELSQEIVGQAIADLTRELVQADAVCLVLRTADNSGSQTFWARSYQVGLPVVLEMPLRYKDTVVGVLTAGRQDRDEPFTAEDEHLLRMFATEAAIAAENARLHDKVRQLAVLEERERLAQELHDGFAQALVYVNTKTLAIQECLLQHERDAALANAESLVQTVRALSDEVRAEIAGLWASTALERPFAVVLTESVERFVEQTRLRAQLVDSGEVLQGLELDIRKRAQTLRIIQEALTNVRRHACAQRAWVRCRREPGGVCLEVQDDGCGFVPEDIRGGYGLRTMRERAAAIGGRLEICSRPGAGTSIRLYLPLRSGTDSTP
jgi:signal transduction histidine kinase